MEIREKQETEQKQVVELKRKKINSSDPSQEMDQKHTSPALVMKKIIIIILVLMIVMVVVVVMMMMTIILVLVVLLTTIIVKVFL